MLQRPSEPSSATPTRLFFVDVARALAILSMLQGHFIALALAAPYRDLEQPWFAFHAQLRGLTAPLFLAVSGLVFTYFVFGDVPRLASPRVRKGIVRGALLLGLGYALRLDVCNFVQPGESPFSRLSGVHVLHVVAVGLWSLTASYLAFGKLGAGAASLLWLGLSTVAFVGAGLVHAPAFEGVPTWLASYFIATPGSEFTLFPWLGYVAVGAAVGAALHALGRRWVSLFTLAVALGLHLYATPLVFRLHRACELGTLCDGLPGSHVYLHRSSWVLAVLGALMVFEPLCRRAPRLLLRTGQQTLFVFVAHALVLYGSFTGLGLAPVLRRSLTPGQAVLGALLFVTSLLGLVWLRDAWRRPAAVTPSVRRLRSESRLSAMAAATAPRRSDTL